MSLSLFQDSKIAKIICLVSLLTSVFWIGVQNVDVYRYPVFSAWCEILSLPMLGALYGIPLLVVILAFRYRFKISIWYYLSYIITVVILFLLNIFYNA